jgi:hypothetical protein
MARTFENLQPIRSILPFVLLTMVFAVPLHSQSSSANPASGEKNPQTSPGTGEPNQEPAVGPKAELPPSASPEEIRQAQIEADTKKLYQLSAELRAEVAKTYKESLSLTVLKKAQEIEKLARSLKEEINQEAAAAKHRDR